jgi:hypothetical protein
MKRSVTLFVLLVLVIVALILQIVARRGGKADRQGSGELNRVLNVKSFQVVVLPSINIPATLQPGSDFGRM